MKNRVFLDHQHNRASFLLGLSLACLLLGCSNPTQSSLTGADSSQPLPPGDDPLQLMSSAATNLPQQNTPAAQHFQGYLSGCAKNEVRCLWFLNDDQNVGLVMKINLDKHSTLTERDVFNWAVQANHTRPIALADQQSLQDLLKKLPPSTQPPPPFNQSVNISFRNQGKVSSFQYDRHYAPNIINRVYASAGGYFTRD